MSSLLYLIPGVSFAYQAYQEKAYNKKWERNSLNLEPNLTTIRELKMIEQKARLGSYVQIIGQVALMIFASPFFAIGLLISITQVAKNKFDVKASITQKIREEECFNSFLILINKNYIAGEKEKPTPSSKNLVHRVFSLGDLISCGSRDRKTFTFNFINKTQQLLNAFEKYAKNSEARNAKRLIQGRFNELINHLQNLYLTDDNNEVIKSLEAINNLFCKKVMYLINQFDCLKDAWDRNLFQKQFFMRLINRNQPDAKASFDDQYIEKFVFRALSDQL